MLTVLPQPNYYAPYFSPGDGLIQLFVPSGVKVGDVLVAILVSDPSESTVVTPAGWTVVLATVGATNAAIKVLAKQIEDSEIGEYTYDGVPVTFEVPGGTKERMGHILVLRGVKSLAQLLEYSANAVFTATATASPAVATNQQAINLGVVVWSWAGADEIDLDDVYTVLGTYHSAEVVSRSIAVGLKIMNETESVGMQNGFFVGNHTGRSFTLVFRDRAPITPAELVDLVPGNIGLLGKDLR